MRFGRLRLRNWRNFKQVDTPLQLRTFLVGPNAAGKSNLLDAFRFLQQIADPQGGFQRALDDRGGVSRIRSLHARVSSSVQVEVELDLEAGGRWSYLLEFSQDKQRRQVIKREVVRRGEQIVIDRPDSDDDADPSRLSQTHLEQVSANKSFRAIAEFLASTEYLHLVPQLLKNADRFTGHRHDPYGSDFLEQLAVMERTNRRAFKSRLSKINQALKVAVPQLSGLDIARDERGAPHLKALYRHWRPNAGWQDETQLSDGTLRLLGLLWVLLDGSAPLLLEEPELSLHSAVVGRIPSIIWRLSRTTGRQVLISTHSFDLLSESGVAPEEVLLLKPTREGTSVRQAMESEQIRDLVEGGASVAEAVLPETAPENVEQLSLFGSWSSR